MSIPNVTPSSSEEPKLPKQVPAKKSDKTDSLGKEKLEQPKNTFIQKGLRDLDIKASELTPEIRDYKFVPNVGGGVSEGASPTPGPEETLMIDDMEDFNKFVEETASLTETGNEPGVDLEKLFEADKEEVERIERAHKEVDDLVKKRETTTSMPLSNEEETALLDIFTLETLPLTKNKTSPVRSTEIGTLIKTESSRALDFGTNNPVEITRQRNPYFFGVLTKNQAAAELRKLGPGQAIFYYTKEDNKPMISYFESGKLQSLSIEKKVFSDEHLHLAEKQIDLVKPNFARVSESNKNQLNKKEAIVSYQNGYSFVTEKNSEGSLEYYNLWGAAITRDKKLKIYSTLEDIKKKPFYFGEISSAEADKILSQQKGPSIIVRRKGNEYYLHVRGIDPQGKEFYHKKPLSMKSDKLVESSLLLKLEANFKGIVRPKEEKDFGSKVNSFGYRLLSKSRALGEGIRTQATLFTRRFFPSSAPPPVVKAPISSTPSEVTKPDVISEDRKKATERLIAEKDWGEMEQSAVEGILINSRDGQSILWRDQGRLMVSLKRGEQVEHHSFNSSEEYIKKARGLGFPKSPPDLENFQDRWVSLLSAYNTEFAEEDSIKKEIERLEDKMFFELGLGDPTNYIQGILKTNPEKKGLIIEALTALRQEPYAETYYSAIDEQLKLLGH